MEKDTQYVDRFDDAETALEHMRAFVEGASRTVDIFSHELMPLVFADDQLVSNLSAFARASRTSKIRILVRDSRPLRGRDHALINLARRLPTHITVRTLVEDMADPNIGYLCADTQALAFFNDEASLSGFALEQARAESRHWLEKFNHLWASCARADPNLRTLSV